MYSQRGLSLSFHFFCVPTAVISDLYTECKINGLINVHSLYSTIQNTTQQTEQQTTPHTTQQQMESQQFVLHMFNKNDRKIIAELLTYFTRIPFVVRGPIVPQFPD